MGALEKAACKGTSEAGWRAIAGYVRRYPSADNIEEAEDKKDKITTEVQDTPGTFESGSVSAMGPEVIT